MCATCGCGSDGAAIEHEHVDEHGVVTRHTHASHAHHDHDHDHHRIELEARVLAKNDLGAAHNRGWFAARRILALNLVSSPGAGKTSLLVRTIRDLAGSGGASISVIEGDQETTRDADRIRDAGAPAIQVNTGTGCHLDAAMIQRGLVALDPAPSSIVMIENVGNLVCPALFDLGEAAKVVILSVTEGDDKPLKYPHMFRAASLMLLNKIDLLPHVEFDRGAAIANARRLNPHIDVLEVSARSGEGMPEWFAWLRRAQDRIATASRGTP